MLAILEALICLTKPQADICPAASVVVVRNVQPLMRTIFDAGEASLLSFSHWFCLHCLCQAANYVEAANLAEDESSCLGSPNEDLIFMLLRRSTFVAELAEGKRVLDIGCVNHTLSTRQAKYWLHGILRERAAWLVGLDYEKDQVETLRREGFNVVCADATDFNLGAQFDLIVAGEIIEHLTCPGKLLDCARRHLAPQGKLVLTCPNANNMLYFLENCLMGHEQDNTDHTCLFTPTTMSVLLRKCGYRPVSFHFVAENLAYYKGSAGRKVLAYIMWFAQLMAGVFRPCLCKNFITVAEPEDGSGTPRAEDSHLKPCTKKPDSERL